MKNYFKFIVVSILACSFTAIADDVELQIRKPTTQLIKVAVNGFSGEVESVLEFDLSVLGMEITTGNDADYVVSGHSNDRVEGSLTAGGSSRPLWTRAYGNSTPRTEAHAFANDIVKEIRGTAPIFLTKIAFRLQEDTSTEICVSDFDGANSVVVTHDHTLVDGPSWIPGHDGICYTSWKNGGTEILDHNLSTGARHVVAAYPGANLSAEVSPDGQHVAMILSKGGSPNLYVGDLGGGDLHQLTQTRDEDSSPSWGPNGQICFVCRSGRARLQIINSSGGDAQPLRVAEAYGDMTSPDWSPDGKQIAFTTGSRPFTICVVPAEGGDAQQLTSGEDPVWAPNSRTIIFSRRAGNKRILCLLDVPTKHVKNIRQLTGSCSEPSWAR
ncbi:MAG TPA: LpqB family beta-propeller domain-containing protein [Verrucomicrobiae bacterium]|jgi:TolB protein